MGTSDVHGLIDWDYGVQHGVHRPVTLVFARERSKEGLKEALFDGRTVVWKDELLIGKEEFLVPLIEASLTVGNSAYINETSVLEVDIKNSTGQKFILENLGGFTFHRNSDVFTVEPYRTFTLEIKTKKRIGAFKLPLQVLNGITAPDEHPKITLKFDSIQ